MKLSSFEPSANGTIVYLPGSSDDGGAKIFIDRKSGARIERTIYNLQNYFVSKKGPHDIGTGPIRISSPQLFDDGKKIVFNRIVSEYYQIYLLDLESNQLSQISSEYISYPTVSIAPNGKHLAFVTGGFWGGGVVGTDFERPDYYAGPLRLFVADVDGGNKHLVAEGDYLNGNLCWFENQLFYSLEGERVDVLKQQVASQLNIYSYDVASDKSSLLVKNGASPVISPDGNKLIFFGPRSADTVVKWEFVWHRGANSGASMLCSARDGSNRIAFEPIGRYYPVVHWLPDSVQFASLRQISAPLAILGELRLWNTDTQDTRLIAQLKSVYNYETKNTALYQQFNIEDATATNIVVSKSELLGFLPKGGGGIYGDSLESVSIEDGGRKTVVTAIETLQMGYDAHLISLTPSSTLPRP